MWRGLVIATDRLRSDGERTFLGSDLETDLAVVHDCLEENRRAEAALILKRWMPPSTANWILNSQRRDCPKQAPLWQVVIDNSGVRAQSLHDGIAGLWLQL